jgi:hypothetical protein
MLGQALHMPLHLQFDGIISEALGIDPASGGFRDVPGGEEQVQHTAQAGAGCPARYHGFASLLRLRLVPLPLAPTCARRAVYPPTVFISMVRDTKERELIQENQQILQARNTPVQVIKVSSAQMLPALVHGNLEKNVPPGIPAQGSA